LENVINDLRPNEDGTVVGSGKPLVLTESKHSISAVVKEKISVPIAKNVTAKGEVKNSVNLKNGDVSVQYKAQIGPRKGKGSSATIFTSHKTSSSGKTESRAGIQLETKTGNHGTEVKTTIQFGIRFKDGN
jgi:hypothetical protein